MRRCLPPHLLTIIYLACPIFVAQAAPVASGYTGKISALRVDASALGDDWSGPTGLVVDNFQDVGAFPPALRQVVEELKKQVSPLGVIAVADFTYRRKSDPLDQITLRVFIFDSEDSRRDWWQKKYRSAGWEEFYRVVDGVPYDALDSKQTTKRVISFGNILMTCSSLKKSDEHLKLLKSYAEKAGGAKDPDRR